MDDIREMHGRGAVAVHVPPRDRQPGHGTATSGLLRCREDPLLAHPVPTVRKRGPSVAANAPTASIVPVPALPLSPNEGNTENGFAEGVRV